MAVTSIVNGPGVRVMFPPTSATRYRAASASTPSTIPSSVPTSSSSGSTQRQQRRAWLGAHRREVTQIDRKRPVTHRVGRDEPEVEMDAVDQGVGRQYVERAANRLDDGGVIAWAHSNPRWCGEARGDPGDERALAEGGDRGVSQKTKAPLCRVGRSSEPAKAGGAAVIGRASGFLSSEACTTRDPAAHLMKRWLRRASENHHEQSRSLRGS